MFNWSKKCYERQRTQNDRGSKYKSAGFDYGKIIIGDDCWTGANVVIAKGVEISYKSIIGANSFVNKDTEKFSINAGSPSKLIRYRK